MRLRAIIARNKLLERASCEDELRESVYLIMAKKTSLIYTCACRNIWKG